MRRTIARLIAGCFLLTVGPQLWAMEEEHCLHGGVKIWTDWPDDVLVVNDPSLDLLRLGVGELQDSLVFYLDIAASELRPLSAWQITWLSSDATVYEAGMQTDFAGQPDFYYRATGRDAQDYYLIAAAQDGSGITTDGRVSIVVPKAAVAGTQPLFEIRAGVSSLSVGDDGVQTGARTLYLDFIPDDTQDPSGTYVPSNACPAAALGSVRALPSAGVAGALNASLITILVLGLCRRPRYRRWSTGA